MGCQHGADETLAGKVQIEIRVRYHPVAQIVSAPDARHLGRQRFLQLRALGLAGPESALLGRPDEHLVGRELHQEVVGLVLRRNRETLSQVGPHTEQGAKVVCRDRSTDEQRQGRRSGDRSIRHVRSRRDRYRRRGCVLGDRPLSGRQQGIEGLDLTGRRPLFDHPVERHLPSRLELRDSPLLDPVDHHRIRSRENRADLAGAHRKQRAVSYRRHRFVTLVGEDTSSLLGGFVTVGASRLHEIRATGETFSQCRGLGIQAVASGLARIERNLQGNPSEIEARERLPRFEVFPHLRLGRF